MLHNLTIRTVQTVQFSGAIPLGEYNIRALPRLIARYPQNASQVAESGSGNFKLVVPNNNIIYDLNQMNRGIMHTFHTFRARKI